MNLRELGEDRLLQQITRTLPRNRSVVLGPADDCALVRIDSNENLLVLKTDCVVEAVHFTADAKPSAVGWKAMARPLSDFAAMSAVPQAALVTLIVPAGTSASWIRQLYRGLSKAAAAFDVAIVGGETSRTDGPAALSVSVSGTVERDRCVRRSGGRAGDDLFVTGQLGGSLRGHHLKFTPRIVESRWLTEHFRVHAMMDLSDGLGADLPRLAAASGVGFDVDEATLPRNRGCSIEQAIGDGEDYELLFAIAPGDSERLQRRWRKRFRKLPLTWIGRFIPRSAFRVPPSFRGYVHFR
ncbi:MAG TPA: thiamine-phosphate kinase [Chthoniobacterales bacterium]|nr:thiamine-phosphate kinase [Chthoniobacterales bacterium]